MLVGSPAALAADAGATFDFSRDIAPIFEQHCMRCHGPGNEKGDISLATIADLMENEYVVAGDPDASHLVELITPTDGERPEMPKEGDSLSAEQVTLVRRWIAAGAQWPASVILREPSKADKTWWSLQPLSVADGVAGVERSESPATGDNPIDHYILTKLVDNGLQPNPPADRRTLIRRATYDLTGLPPTPEEVEAFIGDSDPQAYEKLIDRLLDSPRYGERWGRHWLDVIRFGESRGFERNEIINDIWPFRDYVIRSFNEDKPISQLIREHLAGVRVR